MVSTKSINTGRSMTLLTRTQPNKLIYKVTENMTRMSKKISTKEEALAFIEQYDHFLFDCDGVIWLDTVAIPGVVKFIEWLQERGKTMAFVTNNSSKSRNSYVKKFKELGFKDIVKSGIYPTCYSAALVLKEQLNVKQGSKVWVLDKNLDGGWDPNSPYLEVDPSVRAVVVGSTKELNYMRTAVAVQYLLAENKSLPFIGANIDRTYPGPRGMILPAGGSLVNLMSYTCQRDFINVGKPSTLLLDTILEDQNFDRKKTLMVGDTLYTDIKFGNDGKLGGLNGGSLLVLSGGSKLEDLDNIEDDSTRPKYYIESLGHLLELLE
ncbi:hypothetical protein OXX69_011157 [Metschnikowia pulcherrima]